MKFATIAIALLFAYANPSVCAEKSLAELKAELAAKETSLANPLGDFQAKYEAGLERLKIAFGREGNLDAVLAVENEIKRFRGATPPSPVKFPRLKRLIDIYQRTKPGLEKDLHRSRAELYRAYLIHLKELEASHTRIGEIEAALNVKSERESATTMLNAAEDRLIFHDGFKMRGTIHCAVNHDGWIYLNGSPIASRKGPGVTKSELIEVTIGDRLLADAQFRRGVHGLRIAFVSEDGLYRIDFKAGNFVDIFDALGKGKKDFTSDDLNHPDGHPAHKESLTNNPFDFENGSEWVWGKGVFSSLATVITPEMCATR